MWRHFSARRWNPLWSSRDICKTLDTFINNWRRACDEWGLSGEEQKQFNTDLVEYILDDLMPWHKYTDFSHLEVNRWLHQSVLTMPILVWCLFNFLIFPRPIHGICGFTQETLHVLLANFEGREWSRKFNTDIGIPPREHPVNSTTDDVECFFSILSDMIGSRYLIVPSSKCSRRGGMRVKMTKRLVISWPLLWGRKPSFDDPGKSTRNPRKQHPADLNYFQAWLVVVQPN